VHGWIHEYLPALSGEGEEERLLKQAIDYLTKATGKKPVGYRAPSWSFSAHSIGLLRKNGFLYDSSLPAMDEPYELLSNGQPTG
jgi:peptidoglycan/xylan/chitin deacetylase (PgdA/CDA1 family)